MQVADGITQERVMKIRAAVAGESQIVRDAAEEVIFCARIGVPVPQDVQAIINKWEASQLAQDKYGK
jgi:hypothetical protein